tara:strand:- start:1196 stop:1519 length:324 start_codon:yes stop_codon:yes gene_type:complete
MNIDPLNYESTCGEKPDNVEYIDPGNNPNFVFENDPNFETLALYDINENIVNVNSWTECVHYVKGGWANSPVVNFQGDNIIFISLLIASLTYTIYSLFFRNRKNYEK